MATPVLSAEGSGGPGEEQHAVGETREHVVRGLVGLAVDLVAQLLDEPCSLEVGAGMGNQRLEEPEVVLVEPVELLVTVERDDGADGHVLVHERSDEGSRVTAGHRVVVGVR